MKTALLNEKKLEIACFNLPSVLTAVTSGAHRIELCTGYHTGGLTPQSDDLGAVKNISKLPVFVMIRPRPGNFVYSRHEINEMQKQIEAFASSGADGFVFGILNQQGNVNLDANANLLAAAHNLPCTFHRAFDSTSDPLKALNDIIQLGFKNILSSGRQKSALEGADFLNKLKELADNQISIIAGGGIRSGNLKALVKNFETGYYHSSGITGKNEFADATEIKKMIKILHRLHPESH